MKPRYMQIAEQLEAQIRSHERKVGDMLPTEQVLMAEFSVSRVTIRNAMSLLVEQDLLYRVRGSGTYVKGVMNEGGGKHRHNAVKLRGFIEDLALTSSQSKYPSSRVLSFATERASPEVAKQLAITPGTQVYNISRLRLINDEPEILEQTFMPVDLFSDLSIDIMQSSKYDYVEKYKGLKIARSHQSVIPVIACAEKAELLQVEENSPLLEVHSVGELHDGQIFEYTVHHFTLKQFSFDFTAER